MIISGYLAHFRQYQPELFCMFHLQLGGVTIQLNQLSILLSVCCPAERHNDAMHYEHVFE